MLILRIEGLMFLSDTEIKKLDFYEQGYETRANTLVLHVAKEFKLGKLFDKTEDFSGDYIGGFEYPRNRTFWSKEQVTLDNETIGLVFGKQRMAASGVLVFPGFIHPGFDSKLLINVICLGPKVFIEENASIAYVAFAKSNRVEETLDVGDWYKNSLNIRGID